MRDTTKIIYGTHFLRKTRRAIAKPSKQRRSYLIEEKEWERPAIDSSVA